MVFVKQSMKALILVGGYGTRLRPLTYTVPKPLIPLVNKPILKHQVEALVDAGISEIILALNYYSELIMEEVKQYSEEFGINIIYSVEEEPLGTAGPLALARQHLRNSTFFVLNSDVICPFPLREMIDFHREKGALGTIASATVEDPSRYGLIQTKEGSTVIASFIEKPKKVESNKINAGIYIFNPEILDYIDLRYCSIEREIFPLLAEKGLLRVFDLKGFWMDIGQPADYLKGQRLYLKHVNDIKNSATLTAAMISQEANVVIGKNVSIGKNVIINNSAIFDNVKIGDGVIIKDSIIGWNTEIGNGVVIENGSVIGNNVYIEKLISLSSAKVLPNECVETPYLK